MSVGLLARSLVVGGAVFVLLWLLTPGNHTPARRGLTLALAVLLALLGLAWNAKTLVSGFTEPQEWDFLAYYLDGRVSVQGVDFYEAEYYREELDSVVLPYKPDVEFAPTVVGVGFHYAAPTILLHYWLGFFDYTTAYSLWVAFWLLVAAASAVLLYRLFLRGRGAEGMLVAAALFLVFPPVRYSLTFVQTSMIFLLPVILFWQERDRERVGLWTALAVSVKPLGVFWGLWLLARGRWRAIALSLAVFFALCGVVAVLINPQAVISSFDITRFSHVPQLQFSEFVNQSLLAEIIRRTGPSPWGKPLTHPLFIVLGSGLFVLSLYLIARLPRERGDLAVAILIPLALLIYPGSLNHYSVLLLPVLFWLGVGGPGDGWWWKAAVGGVYALSPLNLGVWSNLALLGILLWQGWRVVASRRGATHSSAAEASIE